MLPNTNSSNNEKTTCRSVKSDRKNPRKTLYLLRILYVECQFPRSYYCTRT